MMIWNSTAAMPMQTICSSVWTMHWKMTWVCRNVCINLFSVSIVILYRMMDFWIIISIRMHCCFIIRWVLMMTVWMSRLLLMRQMMMNSSWTYMIGIHFGRCWTSTKSIWNFLNRKMLLWLPHSLILWNMRVWTLSLIYYRGCYTWVPATHAIWRRTLLF